MTVSHVSAYTVVRAISLVHGRVASGHLVASTQGNHCGVISYCVSRIIILHKKNNNDNINIFLTFNFHACRFVLLSKKKIMIIIIIVADWKHPLGHPWETRLQQAEADQKSKTRLLQTWVCGGDSALCQIISGHSLQKPCSCRTDLHSMNHCRIWSMSVSFMSGPSVSRSFSLICTSACWYSCSLTSCVLRRSTSVRPAIVCADNFGFTGGPGTYYHHQHTNTYEAFT